MTAYELICILAKHPEKKVMIVEGDDSENKKWNIDTYVSAEGEIVLQYWD